MEVFSKIIVFIIIIGTFAGGVVAFMKHFKRDNRIDNKNDKKTKAEKSFTRADRDMVYLIKDLAEIYDKKNLYYK